MDIRRFAPPQQGQNEVFDTKIPGFGVRISARGTKSFVLLYRFDGRSVRLTLGRYPTLSLADARKLASEALREVTLGSDPAREKADRKKPAPPSATRTFGATVDEYIKKYAREKNKDWYTTKCVLQREYVSLWSDRELTSISKDDVMGVVDRIVEKTSAATGYNRFVYLRHFFNWCVGRGYIDGSPIARMSPPPKADDRDRVLSDEELGKIMRAAVTMAYPYGHLIELLALTAQRKSEVAGMGWSELNLETAEWSLPPARTKAARWHVVPLSTPVMRIISSLPQTHQTLVFPARGKDTVVSGFSKWKARLDALCGVSDWRVHDLRRTAATGMAKLGVAPHVIERTLNHARGTFGGVAGVYNRFQYLGEMREALERWAHHVQGLTSNDNMVM